MSKNLPANPLSDFVADAKKHVRSPSGPIGGYLNFNSNQGRWLMSGEDVSGAQALVNSTTMEHGWMRWGESPPVKALVSIRQAYPEKPDPIEGVDQEGNAKTFYAVEARQLGGKFLGDDADLDQFVFNTSSMGGVENTATLYQKILLKASDSPYCFPKVELSEESYVHPQRKNRIYKPVWEIISWHDQDGNAENAQIADNTAEEEEAPADDRPVRRRKRRKAA